MDDVDITKAKHAFTDSIDVAFGESGDERSVRPTSTNNDNDDDNISKFTKFGIETGTHNFRINTRTCLSRLTRYTLFSQKLASDIHLDTLYILNSLLWNMAHGRLNPA